jgi:hypothetical protein
MLAGRSAETGGRRKPLDVSLWRRSEDAGVLARELRRALIAYLERSVGCRRSRGGAAGVWPRPVSNQF